LIVTGADGRDTVRDNVEVLRFANGEIPREAIAAALVPPSFSDYWFVSDEVELPFIGGTFDALGGNDILYYTGGPVTINGGEGYDLVSFSKYEHAVWVNLAYDGAEIWTMDRPDLASGTWRAIGDLSGVENLAGSPHADFLQGDGNSNTFYYSGGFDTFVGGEGTDIADFSTLNAALWVDLGYSGSEAWTRDASSLDAGTWRQLADLSSIEAVVGTAFADDLAGNAFANVLHGGSGADRLAGNGGNDDLWGGGANDIFVVRSGTGVDTINDFGDAIGNDDVIRLEGGTFASFDALVGSGAMTQSGADVVIQLGGGDEVILRDLTLGSLDSGDFLFA
jgi:Ca2+-binding RTX toxin-like protein